MSPMMTSVMFSVSSMPVVSSVTLKMSLKLRIIRIIIVLVLRMIGVLVLLIMLIVLIILWLTVLLLWHTVLCLIYVLSFVGINRIF
jgi:hypothetical protein